MTTPRERRFVANADADAASNSGGRRSRVGLEHQGIRAQDVVDTNAWVRSTPGSAERT